jgi:hypothetical protein
MILEEFAALYNLKIKKDSGEWPIIPAPKLAKDVIDKDRLESHTHIYRLSDSDTFWVYFNLGTKARWNSVQRQLLALGGILGITGDCDGFIRFDPADKALVKRILKLAKIRVKRQLTEEQREGLKARLARKEKL